jgi:hypothetical protein
VKLPWSELKNQNQRSIVSTTTEFTRSPTRREEASILPKSLLLFEELIKNIQTKMMLYWILSWVLVLPRLRVRTPNEDLGVQLSKEYFDKVKELI